MISEDETSGLPQGASPRVDQAIDAAVMSQDPAIDKTRLAWVALTRDALKGTWADLIAERSSAREKAKTKEGTDVTQVKIKPEANVITDDLLDTLGREWAYDHVKGLNEWWKNAADQYIRDEVPPTRTSSSSSYSRPNRRRTPPSESSTSAA